MYLKHIPNCGRFALDRRLKAHTALAPLKYPQNTKGATQFHAKQNVYR